MKLNSDKTPLPELYVGKNFLNQPPSQIKSIWESWLMKASLAISTWVDGVRDIEHWNQQVRAAKRRLLAWQQAPVADRYKCEEKFEFVKELPAPPSAPIQESYLRSQVRKGIPKFLQEKADLYGLYSTEDLLFLTMNELLPQYEISQLAAAEELEKHPDKPAVNPQVAVVWLEKYLGRLGVAKGLDAMPHPRKAYSVVKTYLQPLTTDMTIGFKYFELKKELALDENPVFPAVETYIREMLNTFKSVIRQSAMEDKVLQLAKHPKDQPVGNAADWTNPVANGMDKGKGSGKDKGKSKGKGGGKDKHHPHH
mgnify:FL=1